MDTTQTENRNGQIDDIGSHQIDGINLLDGTVTRDASGSAVKYGLRSTLAQWFAASGRSLSSLTLAVMFTIQAVVIADVLNAKTGLSLNGEEVSWYAFFFWFFQPFGCLLGGYSQNFVGRKHGLLFTNILAAISWVILYYANSLNTLYLSSILMGITAGFSVTPGAIYVCEVTTPNLRGTLVMFSNLCFTIGVTLTFLLAGFMSWRTSSMVYTALSIVSALVVTYIPDSPFWLISHGKNKEAIKALRRLRGYVREEVVMPEYKELSCFIEAESLNHDNSAGPVEPNGDNSSLRQNFKLLDLFENRTLRPSIFLLCFKTFCIAASMQPVSYYYLVIFESLKLPMNSDWLAFLVSIASLVGTLVCTATVNRFGKRMQSLVAMISCSSLSFLLGLCMIFENEIAEPRIFIVLFIALGFMQTVGISNTHWVLLGEIFPMKTKSIATAVVGATLYILWSIYVKTYYYLEMLLTTQGTFILYSFIGFVGCLYVWIYMPETEGKTMEEIDELFAEDARKSCPHFRKKKIVYA